MESEGGLANLLLGVLGVGGGVGLFGGLDAFGQGGEALGGGWGRWGYGGVLHGDGAKLHVAAIEGAPRT